MRWYTRALVGIVGVVGCTLLLVGTGYSGVTVSNVINANAECVQGVGDCSPIPLTLELWCNGTNPGGPNCPQYWGPDWSDLDDLRAYGYSNQTPPGQCLKSVDAARTWSNCGSNPFTSTYSGTPVAFTTTSNGELLAAVRVNNTDQTCVIKRSTDGGDTWGTVFTQTSGGWFCGGWGTTIMSSPLRCSTHDAYCVLYGSDSSGIYHTAWNSPDNGATWVHTSLSFTGSPSNPPFEGAAIGDNSGVSVTGANIGSSTRNFFFSRDNANFIDSVNWTTAIGSSHCTAPFIWDNDPAVLCGPNDSTQEWQAVKIPGSTPVTMGKFTLGDGTPLFANNPNALVIQWSGGVFYIVTRNHSTGATIVYVTKDGFLSTYKVGTITPTNPFGFNPRGDIYKWRGGIYWSSGYYTPYGHIMSIH